MGCPKPSIPNWVFSFFSGLLSVSSMAGFQTCLTVNCLLIQLALTPPAFALLGSKALGQNPRQTQELSLLDQTSIPEFCFQQQAARCVWEAQNQGIKMMTLPAVCHGHLALGYQWHVASAHGASIQLPWLIAVDRSLLRDFCLNLFKKPSTLVAVTTSYS